MNGAGAVVAIALLYLFIKLLVDIGISEMRGQDNNILLDGKPIEPPSRPSDRISDGELYWFDRNHDDIF